MDTGNQIYRGCPTNNRAGTCAKLEVFNWLNDIENLLNPEELVEIRFKNTRKDYFRNVNQLKLEVGDLVAVEANPGHDIGMVSMVGDLVRRQMKRHKVTLVNGEMRKVYRKAKQVDIEKWQEAMGREHETMIRSRQIAVDLNLNMKIGDVEYQGDATKAIFYYIADDRVDFRQLIKVLAESFHIRIEMKQIGARQEAGRIGGIGPCGRELCCCSWMSSFSSVSTGAARYQEISLNPQKLAGQCSKLKCCLNYEVDSYIDEQKSFPPRIRLETGEGVYQYIKSDIFKRTYWYALDTRVPTGQIGVSVDRVHRIIQMNRRGQKPEKLIEMTNQGSAPEKAMNDYGNVVGQDSLTRFDKPHDENRRAHRPNKHRQRPEGSNREEQPVQRAISNDHNRSERPQRSDNSPRPDNPQRSDNPQRPDNRRQNFRGNNRPRGNQQNRPENRNTGEQNQES